MSTIHVDVLHSVVAAAGGQRALAGRLTQALHAVCPSVRPVSQQRLHKWLAGSAIDPAVCHALIEAAGELGVPCSLSQLREDAALIWPAAGCAMNPDSPDALDR